MLYLYAVDYRKQYQSFINGRYLAEGVRMTAGILLPSFLMSYFGMLSTGIVISVGALCVSATDNPGPVQYRVNGMLICSLLTFSISVFVHYTAASPTLLGFVIPVFGFVFSMLGIYGARSSSIGIASLLIMVLCLQTPLHGAAIWWNGLYILTGGTWYLVYSLTLYRLRPYKIIQQVSGDFIQAVASYLKTRAGFYGKDPDYEKIYQSFLQQQVHIHQQQILLNELLFKTRTIAKETTHTGRVLLKLYLDVSDLLENIMTSYQDYRVLHSHFDDTGILQEYQQHIISLADELELIGISVKSGLPSTSYQQNLKAIQQTREHFERMRLEYMKDENVDSFISLGRILNNIQDLADKIESLHHYTSYDRKIRKLQTAITDPGLYMESQDIRPSLFFNNLNFSSNIFRHSLRVSLALLLGYIISLFINIGHSYWILLTIVVILKPAYSLTKQRNSDRLIGTFLGILTGALILYLVKNNTVLLVIMIFFMTGSYAFIRTNYFASVFLMTPYLVIFFHLLYPNDLRTVLTDRVLDTAIGSAIGFLASIFIVPAWEHNTIKSLMINMLEVNKKYFSLIANAFTTDTTLDESKAKPARREVLVSLANLSDAFTRMLSEPKRFQKGTESIHRFVVLSHMFTSHLATLSYFLSSGRNKYRSESLLPVIDNTVLHLSNSIDCLNSQASLTKPDKGPLKVLNEYAGNLLEQRKDEISRGQLETPTKKLLVEVKSVTDQFNYIYSIAADISKSCAEAEL